MSENQDNAKDTKQTEGIITTFPDELLLLILGYLENQDIVSSVSKVSRKWRQLAHEPALWRNRFIYYNSDRPDYFIEQLFYVCDQIKYLHLGGHVALEERAMQALVTLSTEDILVKRLDYFGSCRTHPSSVIKVLAKFSSSLESLSLCVNDELVSFGKDGETCYALTLPRRGLLISLLGSMDNLKYLKLCGGFKTQWYFSELLEGSCLGCNKIEVLDLRDFEEVSTASSYRKLDFVQSLIMKNKDHLRCLKLSERSEFRLRYWVKECQETLKELSINLKHIHCLSNSLLGLTCLELSGRSQLDWIEEVESLAQCVHVTKNLTEVNFIFFLENEFVSIAKAFTSVCILRVEGNVMTEENVDAILNYMPSLTKLCVRQSNMVSKQHLILMEVNLLTLRAIDFEKIHALDCISSSLKLQHVPVLKLKVFQTGCQCRNEPCEPNNNIVQMKRESSSFQNEPSNYENIIHLTISNDLSNEYIPDFMDLQENDVVFHFCQ